MDLKPGDRVGLVGSNGAGKSTLLRVLRQVYRPTSGVLQVSGSSILLDDLETGMEPNLTGEENAKLLMHYWRVTGVRFADFMADIAEFTDLGDFLYEPLYTYSAGMKLRLAFAAATFQRQQILLLDEVVGVGDEHFRTKSAERLMSCLGTEGILVLASHSSDIMTKHCTYGAVLEQGCLRHFAEIADAIKLAEKLKS